QFPDERGDARLTEVDGERKGYRRVLHDLEPNMQRRERMKEHADRLFADEGVVGHPARYEAWIILKDDTGRRARYTAFVNHCSGQRRIIKALHIERDLCISERLYRLGVNNRRAIIGHLRSFLVRQF